MRDSLGLPSSIVRRKGQEAPQSTQPRSTVHQNIVAAWATHHVVPHVTGNAFRTLIPKENSPISIHHIDPSLQAVQHGAEYLWVLKFRHGGLLEVLLDFHRRSAAELQSPELPIDRARRPLGLLGLPRGARPPG